MQVAGVLMPKQAISSWQLAFSQKRVGLAVWLGSLPIAIY
jgi:hypothetical protein